MHCDCAETNHKLSNGKLRPIHITESPLARHDCEYCRARGDLIPLAIAHADAAVPDANKSPAPFGSNAKWTLAFAKKMEELAAPLLKAVRV